MNFPSRIIFMGLAALALARPDYADDALEEYLDAQEDFLEAQRLEANVQTAHGVLGCLAFALFFPMGAVLLRVFPRRLTVWLHAAWQIFTWLIALAVMAMGIWMANGNEYMLSYHARIGLVVCCGLALQPLTGLLHHLRFKKTGGRTLASYVHIWWGIPLITLGTINGGFGLELAGSSRTYMIVYGVFAAIVWLGWMGLSFLSQCLKRSKMSPAEGARKISSEEVPVMRDVTNDGPGVAPKQYA
ncbi:putative integral membrane protein [Diaporthe ampelina]|uniref:Putative integral membrane protein n=1 Tax=Diaporthe ampelina TaxID=1214573 RepID=A0A0G2FC76_9PEZI|nr:putative integral membrane protein [Diaporthe ampelina]